METNYTEKSGEPAQYRRSGTSGHAPTTIAGKNSSLNHMNDFLQTKRLKTFDQLSEEEVCNVHLWQEFGTYLSEHAKKKKVVSTTSSNI
jgi:hypothetical protein